MVERGQRNAMHGVGTSYTELRKASAVLSEAEDPARAARTDIANRRSNVSVGSASALVRDNTRRRVCTECIVSTRLQMATLSMRS